VSILSFFFPSPFFFLKQQRFIQFATTSQDEMSCLAQTKKQRNKNKETEARHKQDKCLSPVIQSITVTEKSLVAYTPNNKTTKLKAKIFLHHQIRRRFSTQNSYHT